MRQVFIQQGSVGVKHVEPPVCQDNHVLVRVYYSFISSGTEQATIAASSQSLVGRYVSDVTTYTSKMIDSIKQNGFAGTMSLIKERSGKAYPIGYSCSGQVIAIGKAVEKFRVGDYVACAGAAFAHHADLVSVPSQLVVHVKKPSLLKQASVTTIGAIALQGFRRAQAQLGDTVCIIGMGLIGQITLQMAKKAGCRVVAIDIQDDRLALAKMLGADVCLNPQVIDAAREVDAFTGHQGVDQTIITAASSTGVIIQQAMHVTRRKGRVVLVGDVKIDFDRDPFYSKEIDFLISCSYGPGRYDTSYELDGIDYPYAYVRWTENRNMQCFVDMVHDGLIDIDQLVSQEFDVNQAHNAYAFLQNNNALGVVLTYQSDDEKTGSDIAKIFYQDDARDASVRSFVRPQGALGVGMIGVGGFAKTKLLPLVSGIKDVSIRSIVDVDVTTAMSVGKLYEASYVGNDFEKVLTDKDAHAVVIATPHALHTSQAIAALSCGKAVLLEKPAAVNQQQLAQLKSFFTQHSDKDFLFAVDFNRSYAPLVKHIKTVLEQRSGPVIISYRMNAGYLAPSHWIQSETHKGRIIGEACHIFDLFYFLTDAKPLAISVNTTNPGGDSMAIVDNLVVTITMTDGSVCTLTYTAQGNTTLSKERMELFFDGKSIVMDDFVMLEGYGLPKSFNQKLRVADKGHQELIQQFFAVVKGQTQTLPVPLERIWIATELSIIVDRLARSGGGIEYKAL